MSSARRNPIIEGDLREITGLALPWESLNGKRVLVTGASGLIGGYLIEALSYLNESALSTPTTIYALARDEQKLRQRFAHLYGRTDFVPLIQDVASPIVGIDHADFIVHAASDANPRAYLQDPMGTIRANVLGTMNLLELARATNSRFLFLSSGAVYGQSQDSDAPITETGFGASDPCDPRACYGESKRMGETLCSAAFRQQGVDALVARISHTYGPGANLQDGRVFSDFIADAVAGRDICIKSDGLDQRPFCYIGDMTAALLLLLLKGTRGEAYNVGADEEMSIGALAKLIAGLPPEGAVNVVFAPQQRIATPASRDKGHFHIAKMRALGWNPSVAPSEGFRRMYAYYEDVNF